MHVFNWRAKKIGRLFGYRRLSFSDYCPDLDIHTFNWVVDPFKCEIGNIPEEPPGLA